MKPGLCPDYPVMVNDWLSSTKVALMTPAEEGAFWRLLCHAWNEPDCTLPDDDKALASLSRLGASWAQGSGATIRACFDVDTARPGRIFNAVQRATRELQKARVAYAKEHGRKGAQARWKDRHARAMPEQCPRTARAMPEGMPKNASSPVSRLPSKGDREKIESNGGSGGKGKKERDPLPGGTGAVNKKPEAPTPDPTEAKIYVLAFENGWHTETAQKFIDLLKCEGRLHSCNIERAFPRFAKETERDEN